MRRARLIINPNPWERRARNKLPEIIRILEEGDIRADLTFTRIDETMTEAVHRAARDGYDLMIVAGGDGTVSEVASGLVGTYVPLGILPCGTYNNIARSLRLPYGILDATRTIVEGYTTNIDVGAANGVPFFEAVGVGLDASLFPIGEDIKGGHYEKVFQAALTFLRHRNVDISLSLDGFSVSVKTPMIVVANGPYYGAGFTIAPEANMADGLLEVVTFECSKADLARHFAIVAGHHQYDNEPCVSRLQAHEVVIHCDLPLPAHADGKPIGRVPVKCLFTQHSLRVIVPRPGSGLESAPPREEHTERPNIPPGVWLPDRLAI